MMGKHDEKDLLTMDDLKIIRYQVGVIKGNIFSLALGFISLILILFAPLFYYLFFATHIIGFFYYGVLYFCMSLFCLLLYLYFNLKLEWSRQNYLEKYVKTKKGKRNDTTM